MEHAVEFGPLNEGETCDPYRSTPQVWKLPDGRELFLDATEGRITLTVPGAIEVLPQGEGAPHRVTGRFDLSGLPKDDAIYGAVIAAASGVQRINIAPVIRVGPEFDAGRLAENLEVANARAKAIRAVRFALSMALAALAVVAGTWIVFAAILH